jgi:hypothetical protein
MPSDHCGKRLLLLVVGKTVKERGIGNRLKRDHQPADVV